MEFCHHDTDFLLPYDSTRWGDIGYIPAPATTRRGMCDSMGMEKIVATPLDTKKELLRKSGRTGHEVPIRKTFVQQGTRATPQPGPLAELVRRHDGLALDLYLLMRAAASAAPYAVRRPAAVWARALGLPPGASSGSRVSKAWERLERLKLVKRGKYKRWAEITTLREDGSGDAYTPPGGPDTPRDTYLKVSFDYWNHGCDETLSLPAKAMLLIALSLRDWFILPSEKAQAWYGLSADTSGRGLVDLQRAGLLERKKEWKKAPLAPLGYTEEYHYRLRPPFRPRRKAVAPGTADASET